MRRASASRASHSSRTTASWRRERTACSPEVRRHGSAGGGGGGVVATCSNSCWAHSSLPCAARRSASASRSSRGPRRRGPRTSTRVRAAAGSTSRRPSAPWPAAGPAVLDDRAEAHARQPRDPRPQFGVEQGARVHAQLRQAGRSWSQRAAPTHTPAAPHRGRTGPAGRRGRSGRCRPPRGAAARGRRAARTGSPTRVRRRRRRGPVPAANAATTCASAASSATTGGRRRRGRQQRQLRFGDLFLLLRRRVRHRTTVRDRWCAQVTGSHLRAG